MKPFISVCTILKNEESFLKEFIESYSEIADEFILVDTGSTDKSVEIIKSFGIKPFYFKWINDFGKARTHSLNLANGQWICVADADDRIKKEDALKIKDFLKSCQDHAVIVPYVNLNNFNWNTNTLDILNIQDRMVFFQNNLGIEYRGAIHENPMLSIEENNYTTSHSQIPVYHLGYAESLLSQKSKRNAKLIESLYRQGIREPHIVFHYCNLNWSKDQSIFDALQSALVTSGNNRKFSILESLCHWLYDFKAQSKHKLNEYLSQLSSLKPDSKTLLLFQARQAFEQNNINQSLYYYKEISNFKNTDISSRYKFEISYRITFLLAAKGLIQEAIEYSDSLDNFLKINEFFHLRIKLLAAKGDLNQLNSTFKNKPKDLQQLDKIKLSELKQIADHFNILL